MGSENGMMIGSIVSAPVSKSSAASSYDIFSKTDAKQRKIDYENLPIKNIKKYSINCLKDDSDENVLASLGILTLNIFGLFTRTRIDFPEHWFLIAKATNWTIDIDNIISIGRDIINSKKYQKDLIKLSIQYMNYLIEKNVVIKVFEIIGNSIKRCDE